MEKTKRATVEWLKKQYPVQDGIMRTIADAGFAFVEQFGAIHPDYVQGEGMNRRRPEGFCLLADGRVGFCDRWGGTYAAPEDMQ